MCYSARIKTNLKELSRELGARTDLAAFEALLRMRIEHPDLKIPFGIDRYFLRSDDPAEARLARYVKEFHARESERAAAAARAAEAELREIRAWKPSAATARKIGVLERRLAKLGQRARLSPERISPLDDRVYPFYFAPVVTWESGARRLRPMRYRVRNPDGSEVPAQYNVFNARRDSLRQARTWRPLFGKTHLLFPFRRFYEWVSVGGGKREIYFAPEGRSLMWAAGLYSAPRGGAALPIASFAMVTGDPPPEVAAAGHDRCPVFLSEGAVADWLAPAGKSPEALLALLRSTEKPFYVHGAAA